MLQISRKFFSSQEILPVFCRSFFIHKFDSVAISLPAGLQSEKFAQDAHQSAPFSAVCDTQECMYLNH